MTHFAFVMKEEGMYIAKSYEGVASQGDTPEEAIENLKEALELYYEDEPFLDKECFVTSFSFSNTSLKKNDKISI